MSITVYGLKNCDSCKKALKHLTAKGADPVLIDVRDKLPTNKQLSAWCTLFGREALVNKRSTTWRGLSEKQKQFTSDAQAIKLIRETPTLMKRPVIVAAKDAVLGFNAADIDKLLK